MNRRNFLKFTGITGVAVIALPSFGFVSTSVKNAAVGIIKQELHYLKLEKEGVEQFVNDHYKTHYINNSLMSQLKIRSFYFLHVKPEHSYLVTDLIESYLLSTDFFINKMDESKPLKYLGLYNPYTKPCFNPFSKLYYPPVAVS